MEEVIVDTIEAGGMRRLRVMRDEPLESEMEIEGLKTWQDEALGLYYAEALYPYRGVLDVQFEGLPKKFRRLVCWALNGERVSKCMKDGAAYFALVFGRRPQYAFVDKLPPKADYGAEVDGVMLIPAAWALQGCLLIGG